jgi:hypothetical protein
MSTIFYIAIYIALVFVYTIMALLVRYSNLALLGMSITMFALVGFSWYIAYANGAATALMPAITLLILAISSVAVGIIIYRKEIKE